MSNNHANKSFFTEKNSSSYWWRVGKQMSLTLFHKAAKAVPAYGKFLKHLHISPDSISTWEQFQGLPYIDKKNYLGKYRFSEIFWKNYLDNKPMVVTSTSGSTGQPTYFLRTTELDWQYSLLADFFVNNSLKGRTLLIDCFGMGVWIGGLMTYQAFHDFSLHGYPLSIITPGINIKEILHSLKVLAPNFKNVILAGYPPFIKDVIDESVVVGINFRKFRTRLLFAAESFTESFREYVASRVHIKNLYLDTLNIYGSAELGAMAFETPTSIFIRRLALQHPNVFGYLFDADKIPTLAQFNPRFVNFEEQQQQVLITADSAIPLIRYRIGDRGGVYSLDELVKIFKTEKVYLLDEIRKHHIPLTTFPFVYVYERADFTKSLYGLQVYPQHIKLGVEVSELEQYLTGKFVFDVCYDKTQNQYLQIDLELKSGVHVTEQLKKVVNKSIMEALQEKNSEFRELSRMLSGRSLVKLDFFTFNHPIYFRSGVKQSWIKKY